VESSRRARGRVRVFDSTRLDNDNDGLSRCTLENKENGSRERAAPSRADASREYDSSGLFVRLRPTSAPSGTPASSRSVQCAGGCDQPRIREIRSPERVVWRARVRQTDALCVIRVRACVRVCVRACARARACARFSSRRQRKIGSRVRRNYVLRWIRKNERTRSEIQTLAFCATFLRIANGCVLGRFSGRVSQSCSIMS